LTRPFADLTRPVRSSDVHAERVWRGGDSVILCLVIALNQVNILKCLDAFQFMVIWIRYRRIKERGNTANSKRSNYFNFFFL
jgi:hypothetical protein